MDPYVPLGVFVALCGTLASATGSVVLTSRPVLGAFLMGVVGTTMQLVAMELAPLVVISPLASTMAMWTLVVTRRSVRLSLREIRSSLVILLGCALLASVTCVSRLGKGHDEVDARIVDRTQIVAAVGLLLISAELFLHAATEYVPEYRPPFDAMLPGLYGGLTNLCLRISEFEWEREGRRRYNFLVLTCVFAVAQFVALWRVLSRRSPGEVNSVYVVAFILSSSLLSGLALEEYAALTLMGVARMTAGSACAVLGAFTLSKTAYVTPEVPNVEKAEKAESAEGSDT